MTSLNYRDCSNEDAEAIFQDILADAFLYDLDTQTMFFDKEKEKASLENQSNNSINLTNNHKSKSASLMASQKSGGQNYEI